MTEDVFTTARPPAKKRHKRLRTSDWRKARTFDDLIYHLASIFFADIVHHYIGAPRREEQRITGVRERIRHYPTVH